jgi:hypothetical protein
VTGVVAAAVAARGPSPFWFATRGSGVVTLVLLTAVVCLGILASVGWRTERLPRFVVAGLHRNVTLLAVAFLGVHVATAIADGFAPIRVRDAIVPFLSPYRPLWLGLGTLACDLLVAVVLTSLLRRRLGYRTWRGVHWLAYASWPLALAHSFGTGSDARLGWMAGLGLACVGAVLAAVLVRVSSSPGELGPRLGAALAAGGVACALLLWYRTGPAQPGWAARAGTPGALLRTTTVVRSARRASALPTTFAGRLAGKLTQSAPDGSGYTTIRIDTAVRGRVHGTLRVALGGYATDGGGVSMTASGVAFAAKGSPVYEGSVVGLRGLHVDARVSSPGGGTFDLALDLRIDPSTGTVGGLVHGTQA